MAIYLIQSNGFIRQMLAKKKKIKIILFNTIKCSHLFINSSTVYVLGSIFA